LMAPYQPILVKDWGTLTDRNFFATPNALDFARAHGIDANSRHGDPHFLDSGAGDYRVADASPALDIGFVNFQMDCFGVTAPTLKALARTPQFPLSLLGGANTRTENVFDFHGADLKKVCTLGEQSATGLSEIRGLIVLAVSLGSSAGAAGLKPQDVILEVHNPDYESEAVHVDDQASLELTCRASLWRGVIDLIVWRNQKKQHVSLAL
jgi:hypothetical protein